LFFCFIIFFVLRLKKSCFIKVKLNDFCAENKIYQKKLQRIMFIEN